MYDCIVVGGGIVGTSTAYHLAREDVDTLLVDRKDDGRATSAGAGVVSPATVAHDYPDSWFELGADAARYYDALDARLREEAGVETGYGHCDLLTVAIDDDELAPFEAKVEEIRDRQDRLGTPAEGTLEELSPSEATDACPALGDVRRAFRYTDAARLDGQAFTDALYRAATTHGLQVERADAEEIRTDAGGVTGVVVRGDDGTTVYETENVVIAGGAWSSAFASQLGVDVPVDPQRGQIAHLSVDADTANWPIVTAFRDHYIVPQLDGRLIVGATRETESGFDARLTAAGVREVLDEALRVAPGVDDATLADLRVGLRPLSADGVPVLGGVPDVEGAYLATGHGPTGLTIGPYSGKIVAEAIRGVSPSSDLAPFSIERFD
ncbi:NAD(P)/FAD-dependent oxidoreductase [Salinirarus marinus]|uniref:NAD(P)/FAD-dependent oxidoreductase n=1 Tax=Salinirarus marinus TaxID=3068310 RepID=UPI003C6C8441